MGHRHKNIEHKNKGNVTVILGDRPKILDTDTEILATMALALFWGFHYHMKRISLIISKHAKISKMLPIMYRKLEPFVLVLIH